MRSICTMSVPMPNIIELYHELDAAVATSRPARASSIRRFISATAASMPSMTARATMAWPMFSSTISPMRGDGLHVVVVQAVSGVHSQTQHRPRDEPHV